MIIGPGAARRAVLGVAGLAVLFGGVQLGLWAARVSPDTFPLPSTIAAKAASLVTDPAFRSAAGTTLGVWAEAMAITIAIAVPAGLLLGSVPATEAALRPVIEFLRPIPAVVTYPMILLVAQDTNRTEIAVIVLGSMWPMLINTIYGVRAADPVASDTLRAFGFGPVSVACRVALPSAAPFIATGIRIAASLGFVVTVAIELVGTGINGIGAYAGQATAGTDDITVLLAVVVWSGIIGLAINGVLAAADHRAFRWHYARAAA